MKSTNFLLEIVAAFLFISISLTNGVEEKSCTQVIAEIGKRQIAGVADCTKKLAFKSPKDKKEKMNCLMKCVLIREKLLNPDTGKFDDESIAKMIESEMPPNLVHLREKGEAMFNKCRQEHEPNLDNSDEYCKSYAPLIKCLMGMLNLCKE